MEDLLSNFAEGLPGLVSSLIILLVGIVVATIISLVVFLVFYLIGKVLGYNDYRISKKYNISISGLIAGIVFLVPMYTTLLLVFHKMFG